MKNLRQIQFRLSTAMERMEEVDFSFYNETEDLEERKENILEEMEKLQYEITEYREDYEGRKELEGE